MKRETKKIDIGLGFTAEVVTYFTQGERRAFSKIVAENMEGGEPSKDCWPKVQDAQIQAGVKSLTPVPSEDGNDTSILSQCLALPDACFKKLYQGLADLTPREQTDEEKKAASPDPTKG